MKGCIPGDESCKFFGILVEVVGGGARLGSGDLVIARDRVIGENR